MVPRMVETVDFINVSPVNKTRLVKLLHAVSLGDLASLYAALRDADEGLRLSLAGFLCRNQLPGWFKALKYLGGVSDPLSACRSAAVCLLLSRIEGTENWSARNHK